MTAAKVTELHRGSAHRARPGGCATPPNHPTTTGGHSMTLNPDDFPPDPFENDPAYLAYCEEMDAEHERELQNGGRSKCPACQEYAVTHRVVSTGYDLSTLSTCGACGHVDFAG